jgi:2-polyprenyl-3-methyl-5-hydroxy-6-metoxy-1,4-benzoquinol methylase
MDWISRTDSGTSAAGFPGGWIMHADTRDGILAIARQLYRRAPLKIRTLQSLRPYICPFEDLVRWAPASGRILDVGCGAGLLLGLIGRVRPEVQAIGFDADGGAIDAARQMADQHFPGGRIAFRHSLVGEPWPEGPFELVSMIDVLHHIPPAAQREAIATAYAHVRPGGWLVYKDMAKKPFFRAWWNRFHDLVIARQWIHYRAIGEVEGWLKTMDAEVVERSAKALGLYGHELIVARKPA